jgi:hypothetical protein
MSAAKANARPPPFSSMNSIPAASKEIEFLTAKESQKAKRCDFIKADRARGAHAVNTKFAAILQAISAQQ